MANPTTQPVESGSLGEVTRPAVVVLTAGGTISSTSDPVAGRIPSLAGRELTSAVSRLIEHEVRTVEVLTGSSFAQTQADMERLRAAVTHELTDPEVTGIVITHGTDTLEETAFFLQLSHHDPRPLVVTGAIKTADDPLADGPRNLHDAIAVAASAASVGRGVMVVFAGRIFAAAGTRKTSTEDVAAFDSPDFGAVGTVGGHGVEFSVAPSPGPRLPPGPPRTVSAVRVDIIAAHPDSDDTAVRAFIAASSRAIVLEANGSGNVSPAVSAAVAEVTAAGTIVVVSSRVHRGLIAPLYGGAGGGRRLVAVGALPSGWMRPSHARIALMALLAAYPGDPLTVRQTFSSWASHQPHAPVG